MEQAVGVQILAARQDMRNQFDFHVSLLLEAGDDKIPAGRVLPKELVKNILEQQAALAAPIVRSLGVVFLSDDHCRNEQDKPAWRWIEDLSSLVTRGRISKEALHQLSSPEH